MPKQQLKNTIEEKNQSRLVQLRGKVSEKAQNQPENWKPKPK